ncbi:MAG: hypothetical protein ACLRZZ_08160 [Enterocloster sp.]
MLSYAVRYLGCDGGVMITAFAAITRAQYTGRKVLWLPDGGADYRRDRERNFR